MGGHIEVINRTLIALLCTLIRKSIKTWEECLPYVEFPNNRGTDFITHMSPFKVVYGFNFLTSLDLLPLLCNEQVSTYG